MIENVSFNGLFFLNYILLGVFHWPKAKIHSVMLNNIQFLLYKNNNLKKKIIKKKKEIWICLHFIVFLQVLLTENRAHQKVQIIRL